ncbi:zinc finger MYM-type protein 1-like [Scomber scombrus]|uniref:Zinc finger MYM-type protein 1-like n=1 Tax=Scomber scombrus TaxID=13677 RepID=A0AAV1QHT1_SCOSC
MFQGPRHNDQTFSVTGFHDWKHAIENGKGLNKHAASKEHLTCEAMWRDKERRIHTSKEISTLINTDQLQRNRYYLSAIIDVVEFLAVNQLPFRGDHDAYSAMNEDGCGLFLSLFEFELRKDAELAKIAKTIPRNATYTSHDIQNNLIDVMSALVREHIVKEVGESFYTLKVDGTRDPTGRENISIVLRFLNGLCEPTERLLTIATADQGDAVTLTDTILEELTTAGLSPEKIISQVYDGASLMSGKHGGVQKLLQQKLDKEIPYVHCYNHQLHLVVIHALAVEKAVMDFFSVCNMLYKFCRKPTVAILYKGETLKRLLDQRWTGHSATVSVILKSFDDLSTLLREITSNRAFGADVRIEATGLLQSMSEPSFKFIAEMVHKILAYLDPPNKMLQSEDMDLLTGLQLVRSACTCLENIRTETEFQAILAHCDSVTKRPSKRKRFQNTAFADYVVEDISTYVDTNEETELRRIFYSCIDSVCGEMKDRFGKNNCELMEALTALDPVQGTFLDVSKVKPLLDLTKTPALDSEFEVARKFLRAQMEESSPPDGEKWTMKQILKQFQRPLEAMPTVLTAFKHGLTFGASTASCENSFSTLKNVFTEHRQSMLHQRKANLIQLAFEKDLTQKFRDEWKDMALRRFHTVHRRRLPLY